MEEFLDFLNEIVKEEATIIDKPFYVSAEQDNVGVDVTFTYTTSQNEVIYSLLIILTLMKVEHTFKGLDSFNKSYKWCR